MSIESDLAAAMQMRKAADRVMRDALSNAYARSLPMSEIATAMGIDQKLVYATWDSVRTARDDEPIELRPDHA